MLVPHTKVGVASSKSSPASEEASVKDGVAGRRPLDWRTEREGGGVSDAAKRDRTGGGVADGVEDRRGRPRRREPGDE